MTFTLPLQLMILTLTANYIWDGFDTYDEAGDFILQTSYTYKTGREVYVGWDSKVRIGFTIEVFSVVEGVKVLRTISNFHLNCLV